MPRPAKSIRTLLVAACVLPLLLAVPAARADEGEAAGDADLPLKKVLLFSSGVGYFEHAAQVDGNATLELQFAVDDVNDLLKSMVVQDLAGGRISTVTYGSRDPVSKALQSFAVDLANNLSLSDLLQQLRGEEVYVETPMPVTGTILGVETRPERVKDEVIQTSWLSLLTKEGIRTISFGAIRAVRVLDERIDKEMRAALKILSVGRDARKKTVTFEFLGEGKRPVKVGYIQETPVWKTSYRLVLDDEGAPFLQGWAIVENTSDRDWERVDLSLVSGQPISYTMNLYQPLYAARPDVKPPVRTGVAPQQYDRELAELKAEVRDKAKSLARRARGRAIAAEGRGFAPGAPPAAEADAMDIRRGVETAASAAEVGELFRYHIAEPVNLARQRSAMLPILNEVVKGQKVSIYDPSVHPKHPLNGVYMENSTDLHIMQGPATVFDGGAYAGDALLGDMPPGSKRLVSYAMDLEVEVAQQGRTEPDELKSVRIVKGVMMTRHLRRRERAYVARNDAAKKRLLLINHPYDANWTLLEPTKVFEKTRDTYRFPLELAPGQTGRLQVSEEQTVKQEIGLSNLRSDRIVYYLRAPNVSSRVKETLQELVRRKQAIDALGVQYRNLGTRIQTIGTEQDRIRKNMAQIDRTTELYARYLKKFSAQEDEIESLREQMTAKQLDMQKKQKELDDWLSGLLVE